MLLHVIEAEVLACFSNIDKIIGDHDINLVNFAGDTMIFLRDINCLVRIQVTLKLYEEISISKINFKKVGSYGLGNIGEHEEKFPENRWFTFIHIFLNSCY